VTDASIMQRVTFTSISNCFSFAVVSKTLDTRFSCQTVASLRWMWAVIIYSEFGAVAK
jgi:hypothetical protein